MPIQNEVLERYQLDVQVDFKSLTLTLQFSPSQLPPPLIRRLSRLTTRQPGTARDQGQFHLTFQWTASPPPLAQRARSTTV